MRISTLSVLLLPLVVCRVAATAHLSPLGIRAVSGALFDRPFTSRRQINVPPEPSVPSQCSSSCIPVNNEIGLGCPVTACCTTNFETQYYSCLECVGMALDAANYTTAQTTLNLLYTTCVDVGFVLPQMALPGQAASGSSSSAGPNNNPTPTASPANTNKTASNGAAPSSSSSSSPSSPNTHATGAAMGGGRSCGAQTLAWIAAALFLGLAGPW